MKKHVKSHTRATSYYCESVISFQQFERMSGLEFKSKTGIFVEKFKVIYLGKYRQTFPSLFRLCYDPLGTHRKTRALAGFLLGLAMSLVFYWTVICDLKFDDLTTRGLGVTLAILISLGCAASIQVKKKLLLSFFFFLINLLNYYFFYLW